MEEYLNVCVLTGDLVGSTNLEVSELSAAFDHLSIASKQIATWQVEDPRLTRFRGDGWQIFIQNGGSALKAAVLAKSAVMTAVPGADTRIAIGTGKGTLASDDLGDASGSAFVLSGQLLDEMESKERLAVAGCPFMAPVVPLIVELTNRWTQRQAEIAFLVLRSPDTLTFSEMGTALGISRQAAQKRYEAAGIKALLACFQALHRAQPK